MIDINDIGMKINEAMKAVVATGLTLEELERFETYIRRQETLTPILNPNFIQMHGFKPFDEAKKRCEILRPILKLMEHKRARI